MKRETEEKFIIGLCGIFFITGIAAVVAVIKFVIDVL